MRTMAILMACVAMVAAGCGGGKGGGAKEPAAPLAIEGEGLMLMIVGAGESLDPTQFKLTEFRATDMLKYEVKYRPVTSMGTKAGTFIGYDINGQASASPIEVEGSFFYKGTEYKLQAVIEKSTTAGMTKWHRKAAAIRRIVSEKR
jgi:hypothetical protein